MKKVLEMRQARAKLVTDARSLLDRAEAEKRDLTGEEQAQWDTMMGEVNSLQTKIEREERQATLERELGEPAQRGTRPGPNGQSAAAPTEGRASEEYRRAFSSFLRLGMRDMPGAEYRALQANTDTAGGFLVTPMQFVNELLKNVDDMVLIRQWATKFTVATAESLGAPTLETDPADSDWTSELKTGSEDSGMGFGQRELRPHPLAKRLKISRLLLRRVPSAESLVNQRLAYKFGVTQEKAYMTGSGAQQPLGVFTASAQGIPTSRDVSTDNTTTAITLDGLINAKYSVKPQYWGKANWLFHRDAIKMLAKIKDTTNQYIWEQSVQNGQPDMLLGRPFYANEYVPNTFTTGLYVGIFGDFSYYWIADALSLEVQRLEELYAEANQVGLIGRLETDGQPVLPEAFARVKLA